MRKLITTLIIIVIVSCGISYGQDYKFGIGVRGGFSSGINFKHFLSGKNAVEGIVATHYRGLLITGLYQRHENAFDIPGMYWYYGAGGHLGIYGEDHPRGWFPDNDNRMTIGVDGVVGLDYKIEEIPISMSLDVMPRINFFGHTGMVMGAGFSVRYVW